MDWIAGILELVGLWKVGNKNRRGFLYNIVCCSCWLSYVIISGHAEGILVVVIPALVINIRNFIRWKPCERCINEPITIRDVVVR